MNHNITLDRFSELQGVDVKSADDATIGKVNDVFYDAATREPEWIGLGSGFFGMKHLVVPLDGATTEEDCIRVPFDRDVVKNQPEFDHEHGVLTRDSEHRLCVYFALTGHRPDAHELTRYDFMHTTV
jgi:hypothetical protein